MDSKMRFTNRVENYVNYRPSYPQEALDWLFGELGWSADSVIADVGAGTGIFSRLLLARGAGVIAVEPNDAMRQAAEAALGDEPGYASMPAPAEDTGLPEASVDGIVCAQSFHWFDRARAKEEFRRILKPSGRVVLVWNERLTDSTAFLRGYEALLHRYGNDYQAVNHRNVDEDGLREFFRDGTMRKHSWAYAQRLDWEGLAGRALSSSYVPVEGEPNYRPLMDALRALFDEQAEGGTVSFDYVTIVYDGLV